jgi:hypothetical protein
MVFDFLGVVLCQRSRGEAMKREKTIMMNERGKTV